MNNRRKHGTGRYLLAAELFLALSLLAGRSLAQGPAPNVPQESPDAVIAGVEIVGTKTIMPEKIKTKVGMIQPGRPFNREALNEAVRRLYATSWFYDVKADAQDSPQGVVVTFRVVERPVIGRVEFIGNSKIKTKELYEITGLRAGKAMDPGLNRSMALMVERKYNEKGYPFASVELLEGGQIGDANVVMKINEGPKTKIQKVRFEGNTFLGDMRLRAIADAKAAWMTFLPTSMQFGGKYEPTSINEDRAKLTEYYRRFGYLDVKLEPQLEWTEDRSGVTVVWKVDEGRRYTIGEVAFDGNRVFPKERLNSDLKLVGGQVFNQDVLKRDAQLISDKYGEKGYINVVVNPEVVYKNEPGQVDLVYHLEEDRPKKVGNIRVIGNEHTKERVILGMLDIAPGELANTTNIRQSVMNLRGSRLFEDNPATGVMPQVDFDPNNDPLAEHQDVLVKIQEAPTGSFMMGVGVNSDAGLGGSLILNERNFDLFRLPTSFSDLFSGHAFRGAGQEFRLEAVPGTRVHRYAVTFREPRLFGLDYSFSSSGYFYRRVFQNYDEERLGGRFALGKRFTKHITASLTARLENVHISDPRTPVPTDLTAALGDNAVYGFGASISHDTRDSFLAPSQGHMLEASFEQVVGDWDYPRVSLSGRQFWTTYSRGDGSGKHILTARGELGYSGSQTPIYDRFYAGGFQTIRGFEFRGVSPTEFGVEIGGDFMLLSGLEYQLPITPDDNLATVFFIDAGTVERDFEIRDYRVSAGFGLRVTVPQMGPVPLAFDFGFPIVKGPEDDTQIFSFFVGIIR